MLKNLLFALKHLLGIKGYACLPNSSGIKPLKPVYDYQFKTTNGEATLMNSFKGKKLLIVNVASKCGFTPQYNNLEQLQLKYNETLAIIGFPSNDFMGQEPGSNEEIGEFCAVNYGVTFPIAEKAAVTGPARQPIFQWLTEPALNGWNSHQPDWNFTKFLIDENGTLEAIFAPHVKPLDKRLVSRIAILSPPALP